MRLLAGSRKWPEAPKPVHILDSLRKMDKRIPGVLSSYDSLSEIAHPNWRGVAGLYSKDDGPNFIRYFGRGHHSADNSRGIITNTMRGSLGPFQDGHQRRSELFLAFVRRLECIL